MLIKQSSKQPMQLHIKIGGKHQEEPLLSPRKHEHDKDNIGRLSFGEQKSLGLKVFLRNYRKEIELPINYQTSIFNSKTPQRCLQHNNIITLYCINDKKPLCVHCMYQVSLHRNHEVVPLGKASNNLKEQLKNTLKKIDVKISPTIKDLIKKNKKELQRINKEMQQFIKTVAKFYNDLTAYITQKKMEQITNYKEVWNRLKQEYGSVATELGKIDQFFIQKLKEIDQRQSNEHLLFNRNMACNLSKLQELLPELTNCNQEIHIKDVYNKLQDITLQLTKILNFNYKICKEKYSLSKNKNEVSLSLNKQKKIWTKNKTNLTQIKPQLTEKSSPYKIHSPRYQPKPLIIKSPFTPRQHNKGAVINGQLQKKIFSNNLTTNRFGKYLQEEKEKIKKTAKERKSETGQTSNPK